MECTMRNGKRDNIANEQTNKQTNVNEWMDGWMNGEKSCDCRLIVLCFGNVEIQNDFLYSNRLIESPKINQSDEMIHLD